jgi:hypothetical protein
MAEQSDNGYDTDHRHEEEEEEEEDNFVNIDNTEEQTLLVKNYILESLKLNPDIEYIRQLFNTIIDQNIIKSRDINQEFINKSYKSGIISDFYLHSPELDDKFYSLLSPQISKEEYDIINNSYPCIKEPDYGSKFITTIKFYSHCIIIILPLLQTSLSILKIDRKNDDKEMLPTLTVYDSGNIIILDWNHPTNFGRDSTQLSKLVFRKNGVITDMYWTDSLGVTYRQDLLPAHIALRPNRFQNCWYLEYNSKLKFQDVNNESVNLSIHCCDS